MSTSVPILDDESNPEARLVLRAVSQPTHPAAWGFIGFMATFLALVGIDFLLHGAETMMTTFGFPVTIVAGIAVARWPRPEYLQEIQVSPKEIRVTNRYHRQYTIPAHQIEVISVEGLFDLTTQSYEPWGRLHIRAGKSWLAIQVNSAGIKSTFAEVMGLLPHAMGISGDNQIAVPAIDDPNAATEWIERLDRRCRRELGRQVRYLIFYASFSAAGALATAGYGWFGHGLPAVFASRHTFLTCSLLLLAASGGFFAAAWRKWRFLARVRAQIASVKPNAPAL